MKKYTYSNFQKVAGDRYSTRPHRASKEMHEDLAPYFEALEKHSFFVADPTYSRSFQNAYYAYAGKHGYYFEDGEIKKKESNIYYFHKLDQSTEKVYWQRLDAATQIPYIESFGYEYIRELQNLPAERVETMYNLVEDEIEDIEGNY